MKKKLMNGVGMSNFLKVFKIMRISVFLLLVFALQTWASSSYSQQTQVSLNLKNVKLLEVLGELESSTNYYFLFNKNLVDVDRVVSISADKQKIDDVLKTLFEGTDVNFVVSNRQIVLTTENSLQTKQINVSGKVTDTTGAPLPGVTVVVKGTTNGTISNFDGVYSLSNVPSDGIIQFSFVGMKTQEVPISAKSIINVTLVEAAIGIEEVVAVGYGTMKRSDLTGSVGVVQVQELAKAPVKSFDDALAGRVAGVSVVSGDGQPGSMPEITIRGGNSLTQTNSPLYVVDGFPLEDNDNSSINPSDIESIDILKDASATAIYGARGANGVIIITTKSGAEGAPKISFSGYYGIQKDIKRIEIMDPYDFVALQLELDPSNSTSNYLTDPGRVLDDYRTYEVIDWYQKVFRTAPMQNYSLSISGGTAKTKYYVSGSYIDQDGIFINSGFTRYQGRFSLDQEINRKLKTKINVNYSNSRSYGIVASSNGGYSTASLMYSIWSYRPVVTGAVGNIEDELVDPEINPAADYRVNPVLESENTLRESVTKYLLANASLEWSIMKGLKLRVTGGASDNATQRNYFYNSKTRYGGPNHPQSRGPNGTQRYYQGTVFSNENLLTYSTKFNKVHSLTLMSGFSQQVGKSSSFGALAVQIANETLGLNGMDEGSPTTIWASSSNWALKSYFARVNYNYKSKYIFTATVRSDGSSKFSKKNRWGYFPSAALAYRLSNEKFMKPLSFISNAKVRIGYGLTGNNRVSDFAYLSSIGTSNSSGYSFGDNAPLRGKYVSGLENADLKWETTSQLNIGLDLAFFDSRVSFTGDYYYKKTTDLLLNAQMPYATGFYSAYKNIGSVSNEGIELSLNTVNIERENFSWKSDFNISFNRSKVLSLTDNQTSLTSNTYAVYNSNPSYIAKIGQPVAMFYGVIYDGLYQFEDFNQLTNGTYALKDEIPGNGSTRSNIKPGYAKFRDIDGDGNISLNDYTIIGNPNPDFVGGFNNTFKYNNLDLSIFLQFSYGNEIMNANRAVFEGVTLTGRNQFATYANRWTEENPTGNIPRVRGEPAFFSSRIIEDGSFLRLKTVSFGYTIPSRFLEKVKIKSVRAYVSAQNLITWTKYSGIDPEVSTRNSALTPGFDYSPYPRQRTFTTGINITF